MGDYALEEGELGVGDGMMSDDFPSWILGAWVSWTRAFLHGGNLSFLVRLHIQARSMVYAQWER